MAGIGILIAGLSGLCSLIWPFNPGLGGFSMLPLVALFGGPPIAIGVGLIFGGRYLIRQARAAKPSDVSEIVE